MAVVYEGVETVHTEDYVSPSIDIHADTSTSVPPLCDLLPDPYIQRKLP